MTFLQRGFALALLPGLLGLLGCGPKDNGEELAQLTILTPLADTIFGVQDDLSPPSSDGISVLVVVAAFVRDSAGDLVPAPDGIVVRLRRNGAGEQTALTVNGQARFESFALAVNEQNDFSLNSLIACADSGGGEICSDPIDVRTDIVPPACSIVVPADGAVLGAGDDADGDIFNGFQLPEVVVATDAGNGTTVLLRVQGNNAGSAGVVGALARFTNVNLVTGANQANTLSAQCVDLAGNLGEGQSQVTVDVTIPSIQIVEPSAGAVISSNFDPATFTARVSTQFVEPGQVAFLEADGAIQFGPALIDANGNATFTVQLGEGNHTLQAFTESSAGVPAVSLPVDVIVDIQDVPPAVTLVDPNCVGGVASLFAGDDIDGNPQNGFQTQVVSVSTGTSVQLDAELPSGGTFSTSAQVSQGLAFFPLVNLEIGDNEVTLTPTDAQSGLSGAPVVCTFRVNPNDFLTIEEPVNGELLGAPDDVDGDISNGLQVRVRVTGSSGIAEGTLVDILVGGVLVDTKPIVGGQVIFDGAGAIPILAEGTVTIEARASGAANIDPGTVTVTVDITPPEPVLNLACDLENARQGSVVCSFTAPTDPAPGTGVQRYELRLAKNVVIDEGNFTQAEVVASPSANAPGTGEVVQFTGARPGPTYHVALVAIDRAGNRSLVSNDAPVKVNGVEAPVEFSHVALSAPSPGGFFGFTLDGIGDFNGDGLSDVAVTAVAAGANTGEIYIYYGAAQDPAITFASPDVTIVGNGGFPGFGIAGIGDFDGDSISDLAIGAPFENAGASTGVVYLFRGRTGSQALSGTISINQADLILRNDPARGVNNFGQTLAPAGDLDNDGRADLLIGAIGDTGPAGTLVDAGAVFVVYGRDLPAPQTLTLPEGADVEIRGLAAGDLLGTGLGGIGKINNDNFDDFAVGAPQQNGATDTGPGYVAIFLGGPRPAQPLVGANALDRNDAFAVLTGLSNSVSFGSQVVGGGSLDGDNSPSVVVSDPDKQNGAGQVFVFDNIVSGTIPAEGALRIQESGLGSDVFGLALARSASLAGSPENDIDNDGLPDLLCLSFTFGANPGAAFLFYGDQDFFSVSSRDAFDADAIIFSEDTVFAESLQFIGDINGDGFVDFALGDSNAADGDGTALIFF